MPPVGLTGAPTGSPLGAGPAAAAGRGEPPVPVSLGGTGLAGARRAETDEADGKDGPGGARLALRVFGLVTWLLVGFRYGVQVVGGPVGIGLFVLVVAGVAWASTKIRDL